MKNKNGKLFSTFAEEWYEENLISWRTSYRKKVRGILDNYLIPYFGEHFLQNISRRDIFKFRSELPQMSKSGRGICNDYINIIMSNLGKMMTESSNRFDFNYPMVNIKALHVPLPRIHPFSLHEISVFLHGVGPDYRNYYSTLFFTGLRTSESIGLTWDNVDFERRMILIRQAYVLGEIVEPKNTHSRRDILMSTPVFGALKNQFRVTGHLGGFVFCDRNGLPFNDKFIRRNVWYPTLKKLELKKRRPNQTRHTAASLWMASRENPEWIATQLGHASTEMLFKRYSQFVPNQIHKDGSVFEKIVMASVDCLPT